MFGDFSGFKNFVCFPGASGSSFGFLSLGFNGPKETRKL